MSVALTSLLRDKYATILVSVALCILEINMPLFINRNQVLLFCLFLEIFMSISLWFLFFHFISNIIYISGIIEISSSSLCNTCPRWGLSIASLEENHSHVPKKSSMVAENKNDGEKYSINLLIEQALVWQRVEMMDNFSHNLKRLPIATHTSPYSNDFGGTCLFQV